MKKTVAFITALVAMIVVTFMLVGTKESVEEITFNTPLVIVVSTTEITFNTPLEIVVPKREITFNTPLEIVVPSAVEIAACAESESNGSLQMRN
ncbi:hypothetical protein KAH37_03000 [bacterium]|nr:hypothetical protein [bacterium]